MKNQIIHVAALRFAAMLFLAVIFAAATQAATLTVTNTNDNGTGSLRQAIADASAGDLIDFDATAFGSPQTITLTSGALVVDKGLTITGPGAESLTISANAQSSLIVFLDGNSAIGGITFTLGRDPVLGAIHNNLHVLTISNCVIRGNQTDHIGGGISNTGTLNIFSSLIEYNYAATGGGGIGINDGSLHLYNSTVRENGGPYGGGIRIASGTTSTVINSSITENHALNHGGGIYINDGEQMRLRNSTVSGNRAADSGGGVFVVNGGSFEAYNSTIVLNTANNTDYYGGTGGGLATQGTSDLRNTIVAGNTRGTASPTNDDISGTVSTAFYDLIGDPATAGGIADQVNGNWVGNAGGGPLDVNSILNSALTSNGGPTKTHKLVQGSFALNHGSNAYAVDFDNSTPLSFDQRGSGFSRVVNSAVDIGAYEYSDQDGDGVEDYADSCDAVANPELVVFQRVAISLQDPTVQNRDIYVVGPYGAPAPTNLTPNTELTKEADPEFDPTGEKIVFSSDRDGDFEIYVMNRDGSNPTRLTTSHGNDVDPSFSPDGSKIVFSSIRDGDHEIYIMNADGTNQVRLTFAPSGDFSPRFSPDGTKIAFTSNRDGDLDIWVLETANPANQINLTGNIGVEDSYPEFSPDGTKIAYQSNSDGSGMDIWLDNADGAGTDEVNLTAPLDFSATPSFSPDGSRIAFRSDLDGGADIFVMNANGAAPVLIAKAPAGSTYLEPHWGPQAQSTGCEGNTNTAPTVSATPQTQSDAQFSDPISKVTVSASDAESNETDLTVEFSYIKNGGISAAGLPYGLSSADNSVVNGQRQWTVSGTTHVPAGSYVVTATVSDGELTAATSFTINVIREDATVTPSANNPTSVKVSSPSGTAGQITLCADIADAVDGYPGDVTLAVPVAFALVPVAPGSALQQQATSLSGGQACVTFNNVPVNVYDVTITIGGDYYTGSGSTVLAVFDPSLGFTSGGGRVVNPQTGNTLHFGFSFKYDKKGFKGQMLVIEHTSNGVVKLKSNALSSLSIVENTAIVLGKANIPDVSGNLSFRLYVTDNGEPGSTDLFGLKTDSGGSPISAFTIDPVQTILRGNIQVPQGKKK